MADNSPASPLGGVLSLSDQFSFRQTRGKLVWIVADARLGICEAIDFATKPYALFSSGEIVATLLEDTRTWRAARPIIAVTELCSFVIFLMSNPGRYSNKLLAYAGGNQNITAWPFSRFLGYP